MVDPELRDDLLSMLDQITRYINMRKSPCSELTFGESRVLSTIARSVRKGSVSLSDLSEKTMLAPSALSQMLRSLERRGFVEREPSPQDRRAVVVRLTPDGKMLARTIHRKMYDRIDKLVAYIGVDTARELRKQIDKVIEYERMNNRVTPL